MAFMLFLWELLTLIFNLPFTKWLYFITIPIMMPYIDELVDTARARVKGTFLGVFIFSVLIILMPYIPISSSIMVIVIMVVCMFVMILKLEDKFILTTVTTVISVMAALMYIEPPQAIELKLLWVLVGVAVVSLFNVKFLLYSIEIETENNLKTGFELNTQMIDLIKRKCQGKTLKNKTALLVISNIVHENIKVSSENSELYNLQNNITDACNFILNYLELNNVSDDLKLNLIKIINKDNEENKIIDIKDNTIIYSMNYVMEMYKKERRLL